MTTKVWLNIASSIGPLRVPQLIWFHHVVSVPHIHILAVLRSVVALGCREMQHQCLPMFPLLLDSLAILPKPLVVLLFGCALSPWSVISAATSSTTRYLVVVVVLRPPILTLIKTEYWDRAGRGGNISYDW